jgi:hypothetical protein
LPACAAFVNPEFEHLIARSHSGLMTRVENASSFCARPLAMARIDQNGRRVFIGRETRDEQLKR